jgi:hypothetical protein
VVGNRAVAPAQHRIAQLEAGILGEVEPAFVARLDAARRQAQAERMPALPPSAGRERAASTRPRVTPGAVGGAQARPLDFRAAAPARVEEILAGEAVQRGLEAA